MPAQVEPDAELVTVPMLVTHMSGISLTADQQEAVGRVLRGLTRGLERELNRSFGVRLVTERLHSSIDGVLTFTRMPVLQVLSVELDDPSWEQFGPVGFTASPYGRGAEVGDSLSNVWFTVSYLGGTPLSQFGEADLDDVRLAILDKAADSASFRHDDAFSVKDLETKDAPPPGGKRLSWSHDEIDHLTRLKRRVVAR